MLPSHGTLRYRGPGANPSLALMTEQAIALLSSTPDGFVVFIEAGLVDHGHHGNKARQAIDETLELDSAVTKLWKWST